MKNIPSVSDLETLTPLELSDLLANVVMLLRRFPDVPFTDIINGSSTSNGHEIRDPGALAAKVRKEPKKPGQAAVPDWLSEE